MNLYAVHLVLAKLPRHNHVPVIESIFPDAGMPQKKHPANLPHNNFLMCDFQSLYFDDDGYIVRCKQCGFYQVAFISTMLTLTESDFHALRRMVRYKFEEADPMSAAHSKTVILKTSSQGIYLLLTRSETGRFCDILEGADNEVKALTMMSMFNP